MQAPLVVASRIWQCTDAFPLAIRSWGDDYMVFNPLSGHTHVLDYVGGLMVRTLSASERTSAELHQLVATELDLPPSDDLDAQVDQVLAQLDENGLIEPVPAC